MPIQFLCRSCGQTLSVGDEHAGKQARCPSCSTVQPVPAPGGFATPILSFGETKRDPFSTSPVPETAEGANRATPSESTSNSSGGSLFGDLGGEALQPLGPSSTGNIFGSDAPKANEATASTSPSSVDIFGGSSQSSADVYYLEMPGGTVYGPVDWATLVSWKQQGRVAPNYRIKKGENGAWQFASSTDLFTTSKNPFADTVYNGSQVVPQYNSPYARPDRSGLILAFGILSWVLMFGCGPFGTILGILAWVFGAQDLRAAREGQIDPKTVTTIQVGFYLGMIQTILSVICFSGYICFFIFAMLAENGQF